MHLIGEKSKMDSQALKSWQSVLSMISTPLLAHGSKQRKPGMETGMRIRSF